MGAMRDIQNAINQALGLPEHVRHHSHFHYNEYGNTERKWLAKPDKPKQQRGDRRGTPLEKPMDFYKRQRQKHDEHVRQQRERTKQTQDRQGTHGNPTRGKWGGIY